MQLRFSGAKLGGEQRTSGLTNATHLGGIEARTEAFHLAEFFAPVTPNPSIERTRSGVAGLALISFWAKPAPPPRAAHVKR